MTTYNLQDTEKEILSILSDISITSYFTLEFKGVDYKIRISDHSARHANNRFDEKVLSFCTNFVKHSDCQPMINEWKVDEDGYSDDLGQDVIDILEYELN